MIPTRDEIERWLVTMRDEIDRLTSELKAARENEVAEGERADRNYDNVTKLRADLDRANTEAALAKSGWTRDGAEWKPPIGPNPSPLLEQIDRLTDANANLTRQVEWEQRAWTMWMEKALGKPLEGRTPSMVQVQLTKRFDAIQADLDRANTEAALARDALAKANQDHVMAKVTREANEAQIREQWDRIRAVTRQIIEVTGAPGPCSMEDAVGFIVAEVGRLRADLEIALAKATTPEPEREAKIEAWEAWALEDAADSDLYDDCFVLERHEIEDAVALMRSAGDGKALLRELRAWICGEWSSTLAFGSTIRILDSIDEMLARPEPSTVYSRGKTIAESAEPPTAYYPPAPVEQPDAAVPDHVPDAGKMVPVLYWLEDGKFARAMLVGKDLLVVDLTFGDGPSVVGKPEWFDAGYVAAYGGLVPESATQGKEPGQWDYGVASIAKPSAVPDDTRELVAQLGHFVCMMLKGEANRATVREIIAKLRGGA